MDIWGFLFSLAAAVVFALAIFVHTSRFSLVAIGLCLFAVGFLLTYVASGAGSVHF